VTRELIELAAGDATATIAPGEGGMLLSLRVGGCELLVTRRSGSGPVPTFGSFLMAPWVGELSLGQADFRGKRATIPPNRGRHAVHGLVATGAWDVADVGPAATRLVRRLGPPWVYGGTVTQTFTLTSDAIILEAEISADDHAMPVALGWHPWFACPDPALVRVGVHAGRRLELDQELLPTGRILPVDADTDLRGAPILGSRDIDTVFVGAVTPALLVRPDIQLEMQFDPAIDIVVVYRSDGAVCLEPWSAWPDAIRAAGDGHPSGVRELEPGESFRSWTRWEWSERHNGARGMDNEAARWLPSSVPPLPTEWTKLARRSAG
jgi:aldose 1-epimerase